MNYGPESQPQSPNTYEHRVQGSFPPVQSTHAQMRGGMGATGGGFPWKTILVLGAMGAAGYWFYRTQMQGKPLFAKSKPKARIAERKAAPRPPKRAGRKAADKPAGGRWFYAEGDKSVFLFKAPKHTPHPDEEYAEKIAPEGGMIWKVRHVSQSSLSKYDDLQRVE